MAIAHVILSDKLYDSSFISPWTTGFDLYKKLILRQYSPSVVSTVTGIPPETIQRIAREFAQTQPAIALGGKESLNWPEGSYTSYAIFCLNALAGSIDGPGGVLYQEHPKYQEMPLLVEDDIARKGKAQPSLDLRGTTQFLRRGCDESDSSLFSNAPYPIELAIGFNNLQYACSGSERWDRALKKYPTLSHLSFHQ
jgi:anaerobic selenocysteine-containing dehydrogenase